MSITKGSLLTIIIVLIAIGLLVIPVLSVRTLQQHNNPVAVPVIKPWTGFPTHTMNYTNPVDMYQAIILPSTLPSFQNPDDFINPGFRTDTSAPGKFQGGMEQSEIHILPTGNSNYSFVPTNTYLTVWNLANHGVNLSDYDYTECRNAIAEEFYKKLLLPF